MARNGSAGNTGKVKIGIIGCGKISSIYFKRCRAFKVLEVAACADVLPERAKAAGAEFGVRAVSVKELLADPEIQIVLNLTIPAAHAEVAMAALSAGKSVHNEKPLTISKADAAEILALAGKKNLRVGCAPDTFLGAGGQTCRKLIDDGWIGKPIAASAFMLCHGHEGWHPDPEFYYKLGGGPMFDMGPYYLTALVNLMGPVRGVAGLAKVTFPQRTITSQPKAGTIIDVDVPTHVSGVMEFRSGAVATITTSFDVWAHELPCIEIYGTAGTLSVPDPNTFGGPVRIRRAGEKEWSAVPLTHGYSENSRGIGVADMAHGLLSGRQHRANGELANHVLEIMHAFDESSDQGRHIELASTCDQPKPLPMGLSDGLLDE